MNSLTGQTRCSFTRWFRKASKQYLTQNYVCNSFYLVNSPPSKKNKHFPLPHLHYAASCWAGSLGRSSVFLVNPLIAIRSSFVGATQVSLAFLPPRLDTRHVHLRVRRASE